MIRRPPRSTLSSSSAASDVYKRQYQRRVRGGQRSSVMGTGSNGSLGCACFLGVTALVFGIVAISTVAWYDTGLHHCSSRDSTHDARLFYGPKRVCAYYGDSGDGDGQSISGVESGWECVTWGEAPQSWHGASDCKDGTTDAFGLGIAGVVLSAPAAALAAVLLCCSGQVGKLGRMAVTGCAVASGMATVFWVVAICLVASKCNNFKETASSGTVYQSLLNVECASHDPTVGPSLGILMCGHPNHCWLNLLLVAVVFLQGSSQCAGWWWLSFGSGIAMNPRSRPRTVRPQSSQFSLMRNIRRCLCNRYLRM
eukprot:TRINITY_DN19968_c0_g1_i2.p1 TRINITY_DN19968_c0_g1~~TRINITY_DN19968_c0_g1_i2.p1  ORF type:complete len:311 (-),score=36.75 TRINITY_DN19968_c0_g1_i2:364-1296(-)